jgi:hypothetical protein
MKVTKLRATAPKVRSSWDEERSAEGGRRKAEGGYTDLDSIGCNDRPGSPPGAASRQQLLTTWRNLSVSRSAPARNQ